MTLSTKFHICGVMLTFLDDSYLPSRYRKQTLSLFMQTSPDEKIWILKTLRQYFIKSTTDDSLRRAMDDALTRLYSREIPGSTYTDFDVTLIRVFARLSTPQYVHLIRNVLVRLKLPLRFLEPKAIQCYL